MNLIKCDCCKYKILPEFIKYLDDGHNYCPECIDAGLLVDEFPDNEDHLYQLDRS